MVDVNVIYLLFLSLGKRPEGPEFPLLDPPVLPPDVIAGQVDVLPPQLRHVLQETFINGFAMILEASPEETEIYVRQRSLAGRHETTTAIPARSLACDPN